MTPEDLQAFARSQRDELLAENNRVYNILEDDIGEHNGLAAQQVINELNKLTERILQQTMKVRIALQSHIPQDHG